MPSQQRAHHNYQLVAKMVEIGIFAVGVVLGLWLFAVIPLPILYGFPRAVLWALRLRCKWYAPLRYLISPVLWSILIFGAITAIIILAPERLARLLQSSGLYWGSLLGITLGIGRSIFSKSGRNDLNEEFFAFMMPYLSVRGIETATHIPVGQHERMHIIMDYDLGKALGCAAVQWEDLEPHPRHSRDLMRIALVVGLYARTLVTHSETRDELFRRVGKAAQDLAAEHENFEIDEWFIRVGRTAFKIWPWIFMSLEQLAKAKTYVVTLFATEPGKVGVDLKMALGLERVLAPSAPLIAIFTLCQDISPVDRKRLGKALLSVNNYYGHAEAASRLRSDYDALNAAMAENAKTCSANQ